MCFLSIKACISEFKFKSAPLSTCNMHGMLCKWCRPRLAYTMPGMSTRAWLLWATCVLLRLCFISCIHALPTSFSVLAMSVSVVHLTLTNYVTGVCLCVWMHHVQCMGGSGMGASLMHGAAVRARACSPKCCGAGACP